MPSVDQTIQLIRTTGRNAAGESAEACSPALAKGPWEFDLEAPVRARLVDGRRHPGRLAAPGRDPGRVPARVERGAARPHPRREGDSRRPRRHPRPLLPARRGRAARRLPRRLLPARERGPDGAERRGDRVLRRALHGRDRRHPRAARAGRHPAEPRRRLLDGRHGRHRLGRGVLGAARGALRHRAGCRRPRARHPGDLHELVGRAQGLLRPARRHRLHLVERRDRARVGVRARAAGAVLPRPAPRAQHREEDGRAARADADVEPAQAARRQRRATTCSTPR